MRTSGSRRSTNCRSKGIHTSCTVVDIKQERPPGAQLEVQIVRGNTSRPSDPDQHEPMDPSSGAQRHGGGTRTERPCLPCRSRPRRAFRRVDTGRPPQARWPHPAAARAPRAARPASAVPRRARRFAAQSVGPICSATWVAWARRQRRIAKAPRRGPSSNEDGVRIRAATGHPASVCRSANGDRLQAATWREMA
jgi:hypothetical protein